MSEKKEKGYWIFRAWRTAKNGERLYAKDYGLKAWRIWVPSEST